jgi:hypothetical protein
MRFHQVTYLIGARPDEGVIAKVSTYVSCDYFSVNAIAIYEELRLTRRGGFSAAYDMKNSSGRSRNLAYRFCGATLSILPEFRRTHLVSHMLCFCRT